MVTTLSERQTAILAGDMQPKFLASINAAGQPNVVPLLSIVPLEPGRAAFAEFMIWKTKANLLETGRTAFLALDGKLNYVTATGRFTGFTKAGPVFDAMAIQSMFRFNPYNGLRAAGTIDIETVEAEGQIPTLGLVASHLKAGRLAKAAARAGTPAGAGAPVAGLATSRVMPVQVAEKFSRLKAIKAIAWPVAGGVKVLPAAGVAPIGRGGLLIADPAVASAVPDGSRVAVSVITLDPNAYQVKGTARVWRGALVVEVDEVYTAAPPVPGRSCAGA
jgi:predicted pyridoxine 5'-phosphate oxidase superfamily flavin-nucleotide-binding protein